MTDHITKLLISRLRSDQAASVRAEAIRALCLRRDEATPEVIQALADAAQTDPDVEVRRVAIAALGEIDHIEGSEVQVPHFVAIASSDLTPLEHDFWNGVWHVLLSLRALGPKDVVLAILALPPLLGSISFVYHWLSRAIHHAPAFLQLAAVVLVHLVCGAALIILCVADFRLLHAMWRHRTHSAARRHE